MSDPRDAPPIVAYVGRGRPIDPEGRVRLERVDRDFVGDYAAYADCVVIEEQGGGLRALESLSEVAVPTILYDRQADPAVAAEAARLGVSEYVAHGALDGRTLSDLIVQVIERENEVTSATRSSTPASESETAAGGRTGSFGDRVARLLELGYERFDLERGAFAITDGTEYTVVVGDEAVDGTTVPLSETICRATVRTDGLLELPDTAWGPPAGELAAPFARLGSYVGDNLAVGDDRCGVLWFGSERARPPLAPGERIFLRLLRRLLRIELDRAGSFDRGSVDRSPPQFPRCSEALASDGSGDTRSGAPVPIAGRSGDFVVGSVDEDDADATDTDDRFRHLFDRLPDAVADVEFRNGEPIVREVNEAFEETFGYDESTAVGTPLDDLIVPDESVSEARQLNEHALRHGYRAAEVERETPDGRRTFLFRGFDYDRDETERGFGIYTDVTDRLEQERRLRVLHRVLRHNLRNEMTVITGYADMLAKEGATPECRAFAEQIYEKGVDVSELGEQVRRIEQALDVDRRQVALDPEPLVRSIAEQFETQHAEATIRVSTDATGEVVADELLETAIENLLENAVEHHPDAPTVEVHLSAVDDEWFDITVRDDGPGIPERERAIVSGDREITQLDHSRGLGLWVSQWVVQGVDGRLLFGDDSPGAEVNLRLRRADGGTPE